MTKTHNLTLLIVLTFILASIQLSAQSLKPHIGLNTLPSDNDTICSIPLVTDKDFNAFGYHKGDTVNDFTLYSNSDTEYRLKTLLNNNKPVLLISSSYTCPVFRGKIPLINQLYDSFNSELQILIVYTVEAHPDYDISPYFGRVNTGSSNKNQGILYRQPTTYGERKAVLNDLIANENIKVPIVIDGPCNEWWLNYAKAPNNATLINTDGTVFSKHPWLDKYPNDINCDIQKLLGKSSGCDTSSGLTGTFTYKMLSKDTVWGEGGTTLTIDGELENPTMNNTFVFVKRMANNVPSGWAGSLCMDICYSSNVDTVTIVLPPNSKQHFSYYFYTSDDSLANKGQVRVGFRNVHDNRNSYSRDFYGITSSTLGINDEFDLHSGIFPNPLPKSQRLNIQVSNFFTIEAVNLLGQRQSLELINSQVDCSTLSNGMWVLLFYSMRGEFVGSHKIQVID